MSSTWTFDIPSTAFLTVLLSVSTTVLRAQLMSLFHDAAAADGLAREAGLRVAHAGPDSGSGAE